MTDLSSLPPEALALPDSPIGFGYKTSWFATRTDDGLAVAGMLSLRDIRQVTWKAGIEAAYKRSIFVTPAVAGWVLATGAPWLDGDDEYLTLLRRLSARFGEAQFFTTHRVVEQHAWARAVGGELLRAYGCCGETGEVYWDFGAPAPGEPELEADAFADEQDLMKVARQWSVAPNELDRMGLPPSLGHLGEPRSRTVYNVL